ncbi:hypothetical protein EDC19_1846 [Natranaerovirga hydrolytica]|uniref:histidine kinase n=1 Tax=Natranaerovirga hydrolytica TaxID=680378 RepID=A0A4V6NFC9_9FIRM|nr:HAMP domain-containing sensor histidine kinase [Natranaerovirga hydrolytica]TCK92691.1 hypothetical protein EDC19_1846 [Natranaerovirga hydrolytica]
MKIQYKLWMIFSSLFIMVCIFTYMVISNLYENNLQTSYEQISMAQGHGVIEQVKNTYPYADNRSIPYLRAYGEEIDGRLIILDDNKDVFADGFAELSKGTNLNLRVLTLESGAYFYETEDFGYIQYTIIPFRQYEINGYLLMIQDAEYLNVEIQAFQNWMVRILLVAISIFFMIAYFISNWFTKPIRQIIIQLNNITPNKRSFYLKYRSKDEIGALIHALENMVNELNLYGERQRRFLSTSSHELKTPLSTIQLITENLPYLREDQERHQEYIQDLSFEIEKMKQMVEQLLELNQILDVKLEKTSINTMDLKDYITQSFQYIAEDKHIQLNFKIEPIKLLVDEKLFLRCIDNLISNAIRYSPTNSQITIGMKQFKNQCQISIFDEGIGISKKDLPHIFEAFYRANDATAWNQEGSGLGLYIVKEIVERHGGTIKVESEEKKGTCIYIYLKNVK